MSETRDEMKILTPRDMELAVELEKMAQLEKDAKGLVSELLGVVKHHRIEGREYPVPYEQLATRASIEVRDLAAFCLNNAGWRAGWERCGHLVRWTISPLEPK
jgi:hypothetical protein